MKKDTVDKLKSVFDKYDKKQTEIKKEHERIKTEHEIFLEAFGKIIAEVIRPTMEELGEAIKNRGHNFEITEGQETQDGKGRTIAAQVKMGIHPNEQQQRFGQSSEYPALTFFAGTYDNKVWSHVSTMMLGRGGYAGKRNDYKLENITKDIVEEEILHLLSECFGK
jgi:hypothetical protein